MKITTKAIYLSAFTALTAFFAVFNSSCNADKCKTIVCANRGICNGGSCTCPSGYEGTNCETETRKKFTGNWHVFEKGSNSLARSYDISILNSEEGITFVNIYNFYNRFDTIPVRAYADGRRLIIPIQRIKGKILYGDGYISSTTTYNQYGGIAMRYLVQDSITNIKDDFGFESNIDYSDPSAWNK